MNSAELVNLILQKLRRVKFVAIGDGVIVYSNGLIWESNSYSNRIEGMLNGLVRNDAGDLVKPCSN